MDFGTVLIVVVIIAVIVAEASWGSGRIYSGLGRTGGLTMEHEASPSGPVAAERGCSDHRAGARGDPPDARREIGPQRSARGEAPLDVDAELDRHAPASGHDAALREEVRPARDCAQRAPAATRARPI